ncbi:KEOPS complex component [Halapricum sp. CBA1109]|uniref:KEOPS complex subunit Cgi121 n=1 Tax=Halapricum sp. CBA1109 TaxID=2668068 RepID=UPI0012F7E70A|nr:KEOPS complex subunit Cgi121 [Halapricum sp. CBA1109]MUV90635.1 KEOPS complex component [Halapricum sp. CBA1109]
MEVVECHITVEGIEDFVADLGAIGEEYGVAVQAIDARYVVDETHLRRAVELADRAFDRGEAIARERSVEILLFAAGTRQIDRALELGVEAGEHPAVVVVAGEGDEAAAAAAVRALDSVSPAATLGDYDGARVRSWFDVGEAELAATDAGLAELVHERVALLTVER